MQKTQPVTEQGQIVPRFHSDIQFELLGTRHMNVLYWPLMAFFFGFNMLQSCFVFCRHITIFAPLLQTLQSLPSMAIAENFAALNGLFIH